MKKKKLVQGRGVRQRIWDTRTSVILQSLRFVRKLLRISLHWRNCVWFSSSPCLWMALGHREHEYGLLSLDPVCSHSVDWTPETQDCPGQTRSVRRHWRSAYSLRQQQEQVKQFVCQQTCVRAIWHATMEEIVHFSVPLSQRQTCRNRSNQRIISNVRVVDSGTSNSHSNPKWDNFSQAQRTGAAIARYFTAICTYPPCHVASIQLFLINKYFKKNPFKNGILVCKTVTFARLKFTELGHIFPEEQPVGSCGLPNVRGWHVCELLQQSLRWIDDRMFFCNFSHSCGRCKFSSWISNRSRSSNRNRSMHSRSRALFLHRTIARLSQQLGRSRGKASSHHCNRLCSHTSKLPPTTWTSPRYNISTASQQWVCHLMTVKSHNLYRHFFWSQNPGSLQRTSLRLTPSSCNCQSPQVLNICRKLDKRMKMPFRECCDHEKCRSVSLIASWRRLAMMWRSTLRLLIKWDGDL